MNNKGDILSGQAKAPNGYDYWLLKFDGVTDLELGEPLGTGAAKGRIESVITSIDITIVILVIAIR